MKNCDRNSPLYLARRLHFTIGENDSAGLFQLPDLEHLPRLGPGDYGFMRDYELGFALGLSYLKLRRPWPELHNGNAELDPAPDYLINLVCSLMNGTDTTKSAAPEVLEGFLAVVDFLADLTLNRQDLVPALVARVDALSNADLRKFCLAAINSTGAASEFFHSLEGGEDGE